MQLAGLMRNVIVNNVIDILNEVAIFLKVQHLLDFTIDIKGWNEYHFLLPYYVYFEKSCLAIIVIIWVKVLPSLHSTFDVINNHFSDIVFGSQTSQNIMKIRKQASKYNFYTCLASKNVNIRKNKR